MNGKLCGCALEYCGRCLCFLIKLPRNGICLLCEVICLRESAGDKVFYQLIICLVGYLVFFDVVLLYIIKNSLLEICI